VEENLEVLQRDLGLHAEQVVDVLGVQQVRLVPVVQPPDSTGGLLPGPGNHRGVPESPPAEVHDDRAVRLLKKATGFSFEGTGLLLAVHAEEAPEVPAGVKVRFAPGRGAVDVVEKKSAGRQPQARRGGGVPLREGDGGPVGLLPVHEATRHEDRCAVAHDPRLPLRVLDAQHVLRVPEPDHIGVEEGPHLRVHLSQQLERLHDGDGLLWKSECRPQPVEGAGADPRLAGGADIHRHPVRLPMVERGNDAFP
jgi:hypothetical protein